MLAVTDLIMSPPDFVGFYPVGIEACSRRLSECDTSGLSTHGVLHPDRDASHTHVSAILSGWKEWCGFEPRGVARAQPLATIFHPYRDTKRRLRRDGCYPLIGSESHAFSVAGGVAVVVVTCRIVDVVVTEL